jgi:SNF2 family DNA or RNA helicase
MSCYLEDLPLLVVVPASMRLVWAEATERWLEFLRPSDIHVIFGQQQRLFSEGDRPKVTITSYAMLR